jgi:hypothetical protein
MKYHKNSENKTDIASMVLKIKKELLKERVQIKLSLISIKKVYKMQLNITDIQKNQKTSQVE